MKGYGRPYGCFVRTQKSHAKLDSSLEFDVLFTKAVSSARLTKLKAHTNIVRCGEGVHGLDLQTPYTQSLEPLLKKGPGWNESAKLKPPKEANRGLLVPLGCIHFHPCASLLIRWDRDGSDLGGLGAFGI